MTFGEKLRKLRREQGLSQESLAEKLEVSRQAVSRWETEGILPDCPNLLALSRLFGVSTDYLLYDDYPAGGKGPRPAARRWRWQSTVTLLLWLYPITLVAVLTIFEIMYQVLDIKTGIYSAISLCNIAAFEILLSQRQEDPAEAARWRRRYYGITVWFVLLLPIYSRVEWFLYGRNVWHPNYPYSFALRLFSAIWLAVCGVIDGFLYRKELAGFAGRLFRAAAQRAGEWRRRKMAKAGKVRAKAEEPAGPGQGAER